MKTCIKCGVEKPLDQFRVDRGYRRGECKACAARLLRERRASDPEFARRQAESARRWCREHPEQHAETRRKHRHSHKEQEKDTRRKREYGVTRDQFDQMFLSQKGACAVCGRVTTPLCVDHCHTTGRVRGLLCKPCNSYLGIIGESTKILGKAIVYLSGLTYSDGPATF